MLTFTLANGKASEERARTDPVRIISMRTVVNSQEEEEEDAAEEKQKLR